MALAYLGVWLELYKWWCLEVCRWCSLLPDCVQLWFWLCPGFPSSWRNKHWWWDRSRAQKLFGVCTDHFQAFSRSQVIAVIDAFPGQIVECAFIIQVQVSPHTRNILTWQCILHKWIDITLLGWHSQYAACKDVVSAAGTTHHMSWRSPAFTLQPEHPLSPDWLLQTMMSGQQRVKGIRVYSFLSSRGEIALPVQLTATSHFRTNLYWLSFSLVLWLPCKAQKHARTRECYAPMMEYKQ